LFKEIPIKRVLLIHPFGIGDALFITPLIRSLKENGIEQIDLLLGSRTREIFETNPHIHEIYEWDKSTPANFTQKLKRFFTIVKSFFRIWKNHYPMMFDFSPTGQYAFVSSFLFLIPVRIGFDFKEKGQFLTHKVALPNGFSDQSMVEYYLDLIRLIGIHPSQNQTELFLNEEDHRLADQVLEKHGIPMQLPIISVVPGGGESWGKDARLKQWPVRNFSVLIKKILITKEIAGTILILGSDRERNLGDELVRSFDGNAFNLCGELPIRSSGSLLRKSAFLIANDSGLVHVANALKVPVVSIFGPVDPQVYGPYPSGQKTVVVINEGPACRPCYQRFRYQDKCGGVECLNQLMPENVYQRMEQSGFLETIKSAVLK